MKITDNKLLLSSINSWIWGYDVEKVSEGTQTAIATDHPILVEIIWDRLRIRHNPDIKSVVVGAVKRGEVYTIIKEENGLGKLKSGVGYISLNSNYIRRK